MQKAKSRVLFILLIILFGSCGGEPTYHKKILVKGNISISGAFALYPLTALWAEEFMKIYPEVEIDVCAGGAGKGMTDALSEMVDLGMVSRPVSKEEFKKGAWIISVVKDAVVPTISKNNPFLTQLKESGVSQKELSEIFISNKLHLWDSITATNQNKQIHVFTRSDACGAGEMWGKFLGKNQEALQGIGVYGDPGMADAVKSEPLAIGYNNIIYAYDLSTRKIFDGIEIIPLDLNNNEKIDSDEDFYATLDALMKAIGDEKYPSPPARELYFVSHGKPKKRVVKEFLKWVLTEGQRFVKQAGYVQLTEEKRLDELSKVRFVIKKGLHHEKTPE